MCPVVIARFDPRLKCHKVTSSVQISAPSLETSAWGSSAGRVFTVSHKGSVFCSKVVQMSTLQCKYFIC